MQRLTLAAKAAKMGIWDLDVKHDRLIFDEHMCAIYGITPGTFGGRFEDWVACIHPHDRARVLQSMQTAFARGNEFTTEFSILLPDGQVRYIRANAVMVRDIHGEPERLVGVNIDITNQRHYENILENALEQERSRSDLKSRFLSVASHEFRTPMTSILTSAELLLMHRTRLTSEQIDSRLNSIRERVAYMRDILDHVSQLSRVQAGRIEFDPEVGDLEDACRDAITKFAHQPDNSGRIHYSSNEQPMAAYFDHRLIRQVINALINNALIYSAPDQPISVSLVEAEDAFLLSVTDNGIGVAADDLPHIFEPFYRAINAAHVPGAGLGLSIAKYAVALHGGHITVESALGVGTRFTVTLPIAALTPTSISTAADDRLFND